MLGERDRSLAFAFDDLRRSRAIERLAAMIALGVVTPEELSQFSEATRATATELANFSRGRGRGRD
jgi:hypothetical protein